MSEDNIAIALVRKLIEKGDQVNYERGVKVEHKDYHYLVSVKNYTPGRVEELLESVLYPANKDICDCCKKARG